MRTIALVRLDWRYPFLMAAAAAAVLLTAGPLGAQSTSATSRLAIQGYVIVAELDPAAHHLAAKAVVTFTAP